MHISKLMKTSSVLAVSLGLAACGGGSSGPSLSPSQPNVPTTPTTPTTPVADPSDFHTTEYAIDWSLTSIQADDAYARGFTGEGAVIGFVDFGFFLDDTEIDYISASRGRVQQWVDMYEAYLGVEATTNNHGHWVASIAAARKNDFALHGVAYDATVVAADFFSGVDIVQIEQDGITYFQSDPWGYVVNNGARVVGKSIGYDEEDFISDPPASGGSDVDGDGTAGNEHYVTTNAAIVVELGGLLVAAAGNDGDPDPMLSNIDTQDLINDYNLGASGGAFIVAGSLNENGVISDFSDRAGVLQDIYLVAPGEDVAVHHPPFDSGVGVGDGTSFAAPHIVGAAALLFGEWPQLSAAEVANILFTTATDLGDPGVDAIYGHGLINLDAATQPVGSTSTALPGGLTPSTGVGDNMIVMGSAFGDASPANLNRVMILDSYDRDFYTDMSNRVFNSNPSLPFDGLLDQKRYSFATSLQLSPSVAGTLRLDTKGMQASILSSLNEFTQATYRASLGPWHFTGSNKTGNRWIVGQGRSLTSAMTMMSGDTMIGDDLFITGFRDNVVSYRDTTFGASQFKMGKNNVSFGFMTGINKGLSFAGLAEMERDLPFYGFEVRTGKSYEDGYYNFGLSAMVEEGTVLGSRSAAGFKLANSTSSVHFKAEGSKQLSKTWSLAADITVGVSDVDADANSLFSGFNRFASTAWGITLSRQNLFSKGDSFGLRMSQPLRVENAQVDAITATHFDLASDAPAFATSSLSLSPTGREISTELGYRMTERSWTIETNIVQRLDAGHQKGLKDTAALVRLTKVF